MGMIVRGEALSVDSDQLRPGDVIIQGHALRTLVAGETRIQLGYHVWHVADETGRVVGRWQLKRGTAQLVIRPLLTFTEAGDEIALRSGVSHDVADSVVRSCLGERGHTFPWSVVDEAARDVALSAADAELQH